MLIFSHSLVLWEYWALTVGGVRIVAFSISSREQNQITSEMVLERTVFKHIYNYLQDYVSLQSGFIPGDPTVHQLIYLYNPISQNIDFWKGGRGVFFAI